LPDGRKADDVRRPSPDALLFRYTASGAIAHTVVSGHAAIKAFEAAGWKTLIHEQDVRWADLDETRELDIQRFNHWRASWEVGL
jgi:hypothetical protein